MGLLISVAMKEKGEEDMEEEEEEELGEVGKLMKGDLMKRRKDEGAGEQRCKLLLLRNIGGIQHFRLTTHCILVLYIITYFHTNSSR